MKKLSAIIMSCLLGVAATAAGPIERQVNYRPDGRAFVCVNGNNRFTRALYGGPTDYRIETSDRPIFASFKKNNYRNIRFRVIDGDKSFQLDSAAWCEARYIDGRRDYIVRDPRLGKGELRISAVADHDREGAVWKFSSHNLPKSLKIQALVCEASAKRLHRNGDITSRETPNCFEAPANPTQLVVTDFSVPKKGDAYVALDLDKMSAGNFADRYEAARRHAESRVATVSFDTPDAHLNPIGGALVLAADGAWDGESWLHGAVGWRMQIPGWRAAYAGDFLGMPDRQRSHFSAYGRSQVKDVPVTKAHLMDSAANLSRGKYEWGTPMYSNGYVCRTPGRNDQFHHYDMNLNYIDELLTHLCFDADTAYMREMWPVLASHLAWEKQAWDPDGDSLYDAYCCIWASDALQYNSGAVTHSSAYNYRGNLLAARIAEIIGENPEPYRQEAVRILEAMNRELWLPSGHWAEYKDFMGRKRLHESAALWSVYTPIDCGACSPAQAYSATRYVDESIPHIPFTAGGEDYYAISTTDWAPYEWSINNVAMAETFHTVLAYYKAGRPNEAYNLLKGNVMDYMYLGSSPGNFGQISQLDRCIGESYRDFSDVTGMASRAFIEGLYGITPDALNGRVIIRPGFPSDWKQASIHTPYLDYSFKIENGKEVYEISQNFSRPLEIVLRRNLARGAYTDTILGAGKTVRIALEPTGFVETPRVASRPDVKAEGTALANVQGSACEPLDIAPHFNSSVTDIFRNQYLSPRSPYTTLTLPTQGIGDWCSPKRMAEIDDKALRADSVFTAAGIPFLTPAADLDFEKAFCDHTAWNPLWAKPYVVNADHELVERIGQDDMVRGNTISAVGFYGPQGRELRLRLSNPGLNRSIEEFRFNGRKVTNYEMESAPLQGLSLLMGHKAMTVCSIIANRMNNEANPNYKQALPILIEKVLDRI